MPVKRRWSKMRTTRITPEAVEAFKAALPGQRYLACIRGEACDSDHIGRHCDACTAHIDASRTLHRELGLFPFEASPIEVGEGLGPQDRSNFAKSWEQAQELRRELLAAAGVKP